MSPLSCSAGKTGVGYRERRLHQEITQSVSNVRRSGEYRRITPSVRDFQKHFPVEQKRTFRIDVC